jgi:hypothetical protein
MPRWPKQKLRVWYCWHQIIRGTVCFGWRILCLNRRPTRGPGHINLFILLTLPQSHSQCLSTSTPCLALLFLTLSSWQGALYLFSCLSRNSRFTSTSSNSLLPNRSLLNVLTPPTPSRQLPSPGSFRLSAPSPISLKCNIFLSNTRTYSSLRCTSLNPTLIYAEAFPPPS